MKKLSYLLVITLFILTSCKQGSSTMNSLDKLLLEVKNSETAEQEAQALKAISDFIGEHRVTIEVNTFDNGTKQSLQEIQKLEEVEKAEIIFSFDGEEKSFTWAPQDINNAFVLFRE
ncbi:hypothetical protein [Kangiella shandongensis]|uniref:hypothetical protein n=1 Tax=Kangiella shandongensis TaxID=2763258 RepID=UPI001CC0859E|nr:hypothetical protein [Kangiella shandongensis]